MNPYLEDLLAQPARLPTLPDVVRQVMETFGDDRTSLDEISRRVTRDPVITAKLLRLANSAYYRPRRPIHSVDDALQMLGMTTVRNVVLGCGLKDSFEAVPGLDLLGLWNHCVRSACAGRWLARTLALDAELAFTVGLMQGIGQLLMHRAIPERMAQINALVPLLAPGRAAIELRALQYHHGEASAALAQRWNLPTAIVECLAGVPRPLVTAEREPMACCVHLAGWCVWRSSLSAPPAALEAGGYPAEVAAALALDSAWWPASLDAQAPAGFPPLQPQRMPEPAELTQGLEDLMA